MASDSHSNMYGGLGALGMAIVRTDAASVWSTGTTWLQVPPVAQVTLTGTLPPGVTGKDVIVALCGLFQSDVLNHAVEFTGSEETMASIPVDHRLTISNMSTEWSALSAMVSPPPCFPILCKTLQSGDIFLLTTRHDMTTVPDRPDSRTLAAIQGHRGSHDGRPDDPRTNHA